MYENLKPAQSLTVADFQAHPVWEFLYSDESGEAMVEPAGQLPVENLDNRLLGFQVSLANGSLVWACFGNFDVKNPRATQHFLALSIEHSGKWFHLARYYDVDFATSGPDALAHFLGLHVDDVFPIAVDVRRYVRGNPEALTAIVLKEPQERLTREERWALRCLRFDYDRSVGRSRKVFLRGRIVKLITLIEHLAELDSVDTIYACEPWTEESDAMVAHDDPDGRPFGVPLEAAEAGMTYFLEVFISHEVVQDFIAALDETPTIAATCDRVIQYATYDA